MPNKKRSSAYYTDFSFSFFEVVNAYQENDKHKEPLTKGELAAIDAEDLEQDLIEAGIYEEVFP